MADCQKNSPSTAESQFPSTDELPGLEHLAQAIVELNTCRKIVSIYPAHHVQVQRSLKRACDALNQTTSTKPELIFGIAGDTLLFEGQTLDPKNATCKDFANTLTKLEVAALTFFSDVTAEDLLSFLLLLAERPEDIHARGGIQQASSERNLSTIRIQAIDYGKFQFTEASEIDGSSKDIDPEATKNIWQNYITHLISGTLTASGGGTSLGEFGDGSPVQMAELLNQNQTALDVVLQTYREVLKTQAGWIEAPGAGSPSSDPTADDASQPEPAVGNLRNLNQLLQELKPDIRSQFLDVTIQQCNRKDAAGWAGDFLGNLSENLIVEMLHLVNKTGSEISPTLRHFVKKFANSDMASSLELQPSINDLGDDQDSSDISAEAPQDMSRRESHEKNVDPEYDTLLRGLSREQRIEKTETEEQLSDQIILDSLEDSHLCTQIARLLLTFMKTEANHQTYRAYAAKLVEIRDELLEAGHFSDLRMILNTIVQQYRGRVDENIRIAAKEAMETWQNPAFTSKAVRTILGSQDGIDPIAYDFLLAVGPGIVPDLVNYYGKHKNPATDETVFTPLAKFKAEAVKQAQKRLRDTRPEYVGNIVGLLRRLKTRKALPQLRSLMENSSTSVQIEVLTTLLELGDGWAPIYLRKWFQSDRDGLASQSIAIAAKYKVTEIVPDLLAMLKPRVIFKSDFKKNEEIIIALGRIGDTAAIPPLVKLAKSTGLIYQKAHRHMKQTLFNSLQGYPLEAVSSLLRIGRKSKDKSIRDACRRIAAKAD